VTQQLNFFGIWDDNLKKYHNADPSWFARVFLNLFQGLYQFEEVTELKHEDLYEFVKNCTDYERQLYCEWVLHYSGEREIDLGTINRERLDNCISFGGVREYLL